MVGWEWRVLVVIVVVACSPMTAALEVALLLHMLQE